MSALTPETLEALAQDFALDGDGRGLTVKAHAAAWKARVEALTRRLESIASDALWHEGDDRPSEAMHDIRGTLHDLGYTRKWAHDRATRLDAEDTLAALAVASRTPEGAGEVKP